MVLAVTGLAALAQEGQQEAQQVGQPGGQQVGQHEGQQEAQQVSQRAASRRPSRRRRRREANSLLGGGRAHPHSRPVMDSGLARLGQGEWRLPHRLAAARK